MPPDPLFGLGPSFHAEVRLRDDRPVQLRFIRPSDAACLREGFGRLSQESRTMRFFLPIRELPEDTVRRLTHVDGHDHVAVVASSVASAEAAKRGLGVARFVRSKEIWTSAEAAVTVMDEAQGLGLGKQLLSTLAAAALEHGVLTFTMAVLVGNVRARAMLRGLHAPCVRRGGDLLEYSMWTAAVAAEPGSRGRRAA
jgi:GNAT superfamily N-acetyltransferase